MTTRIPDKLAALVQARATDRCEYCHAPQAVIGQAFHIDYIIPRSLNGHTSSSNLCFACPHCNLAKGDQTQAIDPRTRKKMRLFNPRTDEWDKHFQWNDDLTTLLGKTAIGRATIQALDMNAVMLRRARRFWQLLDFLP